MDVEPSSGNVFADLGLPDADRLLAEAEARRMDADTPTIIGPQPGQGILRYQPGNLADLLNLPAGTVITGMRVASDGDLCVRVAHNCLRKVVPGQRVPEVTPAELGTAYIRWRVEG